MRWVFACVLFAACGGTPRTTDCPELLPAVTLAGGLTCVDVGQDLNRARLTVLLAAGPDPKLGDWRLTYRAEHWQDSAGMEVVGQTWPDTHDVWIRADSRCVLTHELFHVYEWDVLHVVNPTHTGWREKGWFAAVESVCLGPH